MKTLMILYNRPISVHADVSGSRVDAYFDYGYFEDGEGEGLTDKELASVTLMYTEELEDRWLDGAIERAEAMAEGMER